MTRVEIVNLMRNKRYLLEMGSGKLAKRFKCTRDDIVFAKREVRGEGLVKLRIPKILILDLEMAPMRAYVWRRWKENISLDQTISDNFILCWSAKWLYEDKVYSAALTPKEIAAEDDSRIAIDIWSLVNQADIVIAYNGKKADIPWLNSAFLKAKIAPPKPYFLVDPCDVVRRVFGFTSNKMDAIAGYLGIEHKLDTDFNLWKRCMEGDVDAMRYMVEYNQMDVKILEEIYIRLRPWIPRHPNIANLMDADICPICGSENFEDTSKFYYTTSNKYKLYRCYECGSLFRSRTAEPRDEKVKNIVCGHQ